VSSSARNKVLTKLLGRKRQPRHVLVPAHLAHGAPSRYCADTGHLSYHDPPCLGIPDASFPTPPEDIPTNENKCHYTMTLFIDVHVTQQ
jgi:hypothetical protein